VAGRHVAFLRGINVGRAKRVAMSDLRKLVEDLGYRDVVTLLNSGNVVFTVPGGVRGDPAERIERGIAERLGVTCKVTTLAADELAEAVRANPLRQCSEDPSRFLVAVLRSDSHRALLKPLARQKWDKEAFAIGDRVAYMWCPVGILDSPLGVALGKALGDGVTTRNWNTMVKLLALAGGGGTPEAVPKSRAKGRGKR
jgi:uncharacterized protein (DUF1697 family)